MNIGKLERITLTKHLAVMIKAGIGLSQALENLAEQSKGDSKKILSQIKIKLDNGSNLATAMSKFPNTFDEFYLGIVKVGEQTGKLDSSLEYLAVQQSKEYALEKKVTGALMYPGIILTATIGLAAFISLFILPKLTSFFDAFSEKLPMATVILLALSNFMKNYGLVFFGGILFLIIGFLLLLKISIIKLWWDGLILKIPLVGRLLIEREVSRFARNLGTMIKSGLPIFEALKIAMNSQSNLAYKKAILELSNSLEKGKKMTEILKQPHYKLLFPRLVTDMVAVGEETGTVEESLFYVSQFYEEDIEETAKNMTTILEPAILLIIGLMVAFVALAIISPIYQLTGALG
jgi:type IV pilus assembly protein PilC